MADEEVRCVAPAGDRCGEGATWDESAGVLYWCDINRFLLHRFDPAAGTVKSWDFGEPVVAMALTDQADRLLVALGSRLIFWSPQDESRTDQGFRLPGWPSQRLNDGRAGPDGAFWAGSMSNNVGPNGEDLPVRPREGALYRVTSGRATLCRDGIGIANTLCWSPDERQFTFADTLRNTIWRYDFDRGAGTIANERVFFKGFGRGLPDGSAMDSAGFLWNCRYGGRCVVRIAPDGQVDRIVEMPVDNPTTCAFGGPDFCTLFITSSSGGADRLAGSLFALEAPAPGLAGYRFAAGPSPRVRESGREDVLF